jgi:copper oxidase (laccase) domain-containing protein
VVAVTASDAAARPEADGLVTNDPSVCLGVYVADCCAIYLVDPERRAIGLLHSGRKGSELGIARAGVERMVAEYGCDPAGMIAQLSPCIRPPHYEVDFAAQIVAACREAGVGTIVDCGVCTACHPDRYYSYRLEQGRTGRMLAVLAL